MQLPSFEGPLDLLLHFVRTRDIDIRRLPIAPMCRDYLEFLRACEEIDLTLSSEWLAMAARLLYIKSCTLLPGRGLDEAPGTESYWPDTEDPRGKLIRELMDRERLLAIRRAMPALRLRESGSLARHTRSGSEMDTESSRTYDLGEISVYDLLDLFRRCLIRRREREPLELEVHHMSLGEAIRDILRNWLPKGVTKLFRALLPERYTLHRAVMTFLAVLELARTGRVKMDQADPFEPLSVERVR